MNSNQLSDFSNSIDTFEKACATGNIEHIQEQLKNGASVLTVNRQTGAAPLHFAAQSGSVEAFEYLLKRGAYLNQQIPINGMTPLMMAVWHKHIALTEFILEQPQVNVEIVAHYGLKARDLSRFGFKQPFDDQAQAIIAKFDALFEAYLAKRDELESNPLFKIILSAESDQQKAKAIRDGVAHGDISKEAINAVMPHKSNGNDAHTPILLASRDGLVETTKVLLEHGADQTIVDSYMRSLPMHKAAFSGHAEVLSVLLADEKAHQTINAQGPLNGYTPLHDAVWNGHFDCVKVLIESGCDTKIEGHDGFTPIDFATRLNRDEILKLL